MITITFICFTINSSILFNLLHHTNLNIFSLWITKLVPFGEVGNSHTLRIPPNAYEIQTNFHTFTPSILNKENWMISFRRVDRVKIHSRTLLTTHATVIVINNPIDPSHCDKNG